MITTNLNKPARRWLDLPIPAAAGVAIFILYLITGLVWQLRSAPQIAAVPTPALPIIIIASPIADGPRPTPAAVVAAFAPNQLHKALVAYGAPDASTAIGAIEAGRTYNILARYGADWLQANVAGSGVVWLKADQVLDLPAGLADLKPTPAPIVVNQPIYVSAPALAVATPTEQLYTTAQSDQERTAEQEAQRRAAIQGHYANP